MCAARTILPRVSTLGDRVSARDREEFVGRAAERARLEALLDPASGVSVVFVHGPGGIGKSALLRQVARAAGGRGWSPYWLEGRDLPPVSDAMELVLADILGVERPLVIFDTYEHLAGLDGYLRSRFVPALPEDAVVLIGGRGRPDAGWFAGGWEHVVREVPLGGLTQEESRELLCRSGLRDRGIAERLVAWAQGSPLALSLGAHSAQPADGTPAVGPPLDADSLSALVARLVDREADTDRRRVLAVAALSRVTTPQLLAEVLPDADGDEAFRWLASRSFAEPLADGLALHALVAEALRAELRRRDPAGEMRLRRALVDRLYERSRGGQIALSVDLAHLVTTDAIRWGYSWDAGSRYRVDAVQAGDGARVRDLLAARGQEAMWALAEPFFAEAPGNVGMIRDRSDRLIHYLIAVTPDNAPPAAHRDPLLGPWLTHAREVLRTGNAVLWHDTIPLREDVGDAESLIGMGGILRSGLSNPRYGYLPIDPQHDEAVGFATTLGADRVPALDRPVGDHQIHCYIIDFGPGGVLGYQRDWVYRELGLVPPGDRTAAGTTPELVREALLGLRDPERLEGHPLAPGTSHTERSAAVRRTVERALGCFGAGDEDRVLRTVIERAYLGERIGHDALARELYLSRSSYFRRLRVAVERLADEIQAVR